MFNLIKGCRLNHFIEFPALGVDWVSDILWDACTEKRLQPTWMRQTDTWLGKLRWLWEESKSLSDERVYDRREQDKVIPKTDVEMAVNNNIKSRAPKIKCEVVRPIIWSSAAASKPPLWRTETKLHSEEIPSSTDNPKDDENSWWRVPDVVIQVAKEAEMKHQKERKEPMKEVAKLGEEERLARTRQVMLKIIIKKLAKHQKRRPAPMQVFPTKCGKRSRLQRKSQKLEEEERLSLTRKVMLMMKKK